jgi:pimeloyl-ACP methyl ester carboxylesterase
MKHMKNFFLYYPWKMLVKAGTNGVSTTDYGKKLMYQMTMEYDNDRRRYAQISGHGLKMLGEAYEKDLPYELKCPALLICGKKDRSGAAIRYNKAWHKATGIPIAWIKDAGHNSNTDKPHVVNKLIEKW